MTQNEQWALQSSDLLLLLQISFILTLVIYNSSYHLQVDLALL